MRPVGCPLSPSSSLPPLAKLSHFTELQIFSALESLATVYCPLPVSLASTQKPSHSLSLTDSGYTSGEDGEGSNPKDLEHGLATLRADVYERAFAERWLTGFIARADELPCLLSEESRERAVDEASCVLESFYSNPADDAELDEDHAVFTRDFTFRLCDDEERPIEIKLNDGLAGTNSEDADDVGLQSWGASIVLSQLMCTSPATLNLTHAFLRDSPRIIELGAGTGLVSLVLGALLPRLQLRNATVIATDYHPAVLANLRSNVTLNFPSETSKAVETAVLDWSAPRFDSPLDKEADMLIAADVVYAPEHATWLRDCATQLLAPNGIFWMLVTVRENGKFEGIKDTVEPAFADQGRPVGKDGRQLTILQSEKLEKQRGIGRGDESGYKLLRIGWA